MTGITPVRALASRIDDECKRAFKEGAYNLVLGAGASFGATSADGRILPMGNHFAEELASIFGLRLASDTPLAYAWDAAVRKAGGEDAVRRRAIVPRFAGCTPAEYHKRISSFVWRRAYTFNVDDVVQAAYRAVGRAALQEVVPYHFDDEHRDPEPEFDKLQMVFLHGDASRDDKPIVFGPPAYASTTTRQHTWWHVFADNLLFQPAVVIGATLREPDFEAYLALKCAPQRVFGSPSFFVNPSIDDAVLAICERLGLTPIEGTGEEFLNELDTILGARERPSSRLARGSRALSLLATIKSAPTLATFARQFLVVNSKDHWPESRNDDKRFYDGEDPRWDDIKADRDVPLNFEAKLVAEVVSELKRKSTAGKARKPRVLLVEGTAGSGKTTSIMRMAAEVAAKGYASLYFVASDRLRDEVLVEIAANSTEPFAIFVDDFAENFNQITRLCEGYPSDGPPCVIVGAERSARKDFIRRHFESVAPVEFERIPPLVLPEATELATKLRSAAKLGEFAGKTDDTLGRLFVGTDARDWGGQLLVILMEVVPGGRFHERIASEWSSLPSGNARTFYGVVCLASACGVPLRSAIVFRAVGSSDSGGLFKAMDGGVLSGLLRWRGETVEPRHRVVAEEIVSHCMTTAQLFDVSLRVARAVAPYVSRQTIMTRSPEARLARQLMDSDGIVVPRLGEQSESWFTQLADAFGWNSRYWEQRALLAMKKKNYSRARDYATQAIGIERHPLPLTTCARVRIDSAEHDKALALSVRRELLESGVRLLDEAIRVADSRGRVEVHPYHVLLDHSVRAAKRIFGAVPDWMRELVKLHANGAELTFPREIEIRQAIQRLRANGLI